MAANGPVSVASVIAQIVAIDGAGFHVGASYFADLYRADRERIRIAKRLTLGSDLERELYFEKLRLFRAGATKCAWCECALTELRHSRILGVVLVHVACGIQFDQWFRSNESAIVEGVR